MCGKVFLSGRNVMEEFKSHLDSSTPAAEELHSSTELSAPDRPESKIYYLKYRCIDIYILDCPVMCGPPWSRSAVSHVSQFFLLRCFCWPVFMLCPLQENTYLWRTSLYLAASASAEFFADIALAPMEAAKVRIQTQPGYANTLRECAPKMFAEEGLWA